MRRLVPGAATREAYGNALIALGAEDPRIVVLDADLSVSTMTARFGGRYPDRFFNVGVCEQNLIGIAAGLAACGKIAFASSFAVFAPGRCFDQLRVVVAQPKANVKLVASHAGLITGADGKSAQALEDVALMRALHGFVVMVPADETCAFWATHAAARHVGPVYIRLGRAKAVRVYDSFDTFEIGRAVEVVEGQDVTIIANGVMVAAAIEAAEMLDVEGVRARVLDMHTVVPLDRDAVVRATTETGALVVAEEHFLAGGTGEAVARTVAEAAPAPIEFVAARDYGISGEADELLAQYHLTAADVAAAARRALDRKGRR
ncbi:MAG: transketolase family protein [Chloroflexi bacterium]|nr:transketolase family protein [Chloroflexota bacterium]